MKKMSSPSPGACAAGALELPRYFPGLLVTADELTQDQRYFRERLRLHNRLLWGWGTVCGALVRRIPIEDDATRLDPWRVEVTPGYLLGPYGDDIVIGGAVVVDLRTGGVAGTAGEEAEAAAGDPWCSRVCVPRAPGPVVVAVRYRECLTRPVRVQPAGCGCAGEQCEYSRVRDGYEIGILDGCPKSHQGEPPDLEPGRGPIPACPPCPDDPWVALAVITLDANGIAGEPDNCSCRRMVLSLAPFWWRCSEKAAPAPGGERPPLGNVTWTRPNREAVTRPEFSRGETVIVTVTAAGADAGSRIVLPAGFEVGAVTVAGDTLTATVTVSAGAAAGAHPVTVVAADGRVLGERKDAFRVLAGATPAPAPPVGGVTPAPPPPAGGATPAPVPPGGGATPEPARPAGGAAVEGRAAPRPRKRGKGRARSGESGGGGEGGGGEG